MKAGAKKVFGLALIATGEPGYPERWQTLLGPKAPPLLMVLGNELLLEKPGVGFCGSRKASEKGLATAWDCSDQLAHEGINIISGYAAGVDMAAHRAVNCLCRVRTLYSKAEVRAELI